MSKLLRKPIELLSGMSFSFVNGLLEVTGKKGSLSLIVNPNLKVVQNNNCLFFEFVDASLAQDRKMKALLGTFSVRLRSMIEGIHSGFEKKLLLVGVGYKAQVSGRKLSLSLGYSHPVEYEIVDGVEIVCPSPTEIIVRAMDKNLLGMTAANIKSFRSVEPYQGKGIRYSDENVFRKETKKKK